MTAGDELPLFAAATGPPLRSFDPASADICEMVDWLDGQIAARLDWLASHGPRSRRPWPETDIEAKRHGLVMMRRLRRLLTGREAP